MSIRLEMLQAARLAPTLLGPEATQQITAFIHSTALPGGGFRDRAGAPDVYYSSFAVDALTALRAPLPEGLDRFLQEQSREAQDFVALCALVRIASAVAREACQLSLDLESLYARIEAHRSLDGGYHSEPGGESGSAYAGFLAYGAYADHHRLPPEPERLGQSLQPLGQASGGWSNDPALPLANLPATAAAVALSRNLRLPIPENTAAFVLGCRHPASGGFLPFPGAPLPDLLSTAVALHTLDGLQTDWREGREACLDFVDSLWTAEGGFFGHWDDDTLDVEYTYYGLLALGHLAL